MMLKALSWALLYLDAFLGAVSVHPGITPPSLGGGRARTWFTLGVGATGAGVRDSGSFGEGGGRERGEGELDEWEQKRMTGKTGGEERG